MPRKKSAIVPRLVLGAGFASVVPACALACGGPDPLLGGYGGPLGGDVAVAFDRSFSGGDVALAFDRSFSGGDVALAFDAPSFGGDVDDGAPSDAVDEADADDPDD